MNINKRICLRDEPSMLACEETWHPTATVYLPRPLDYAGATRWIAKRFRRWAWVKPLTVEVEL